MCRARGKSYCTVKGAFFWSINRRENVGRTCKCNKIHRIMRGSFLFGFMGLRMGGRRLYAPFSVVNIKRIKVSVCVYGVTQLPTFVLLYDYCFFKI